MQVNAPGGGDAGIRKVACFFYVLFGEDNVDNILNEAKKAHEAYPEHHVKIIGYDPYKQSQGTAFVVYRGPMK